ncbi:MAG: pilus assembly protein [Oceanicaulis sp.]|jgi:tight adherence protein B|uniref:type II secretion system F family protein n=1 Tax=Oceanicaulis sp. UBA2681 TaxID=1947007 RepID=UPI000C09A61F|nr:type II secretion system F family protein [Oceanicaulis sp. UBA2681]MAP48074.1 pilus assembly protein [Oceanicaulis sp.]MBL4537611.1 type II secretion system F family protein [Oceanicaulis sp.]VXC98840.1 Pilus assembly protein [Oceanicaulis sp. 350]HCR65524.1 pilus assembly protein [Oceanicaulis sp.]|tara:strand:- start:1300 stop:2295 length:996 start_codon:yes stop_codon:yes gene_type:complete
MPPELALYVAAGCAFIAVAGVGFAFVGSGEEKNRKMRLEGAVGGPVQTGRRRVSAVDSANQKRRQIQEGLKELEERQKAERKQSLTLRARLDQAGLLKTGPMQFWIISAILGIVAAFAVIVAGLNPLISIAAAVIAGLGLPRWVLGMMRNARQKKFTENFADALDIIVRGVKSGLPLNETLKIIAQEGEAPVKQEFQLLVEGLAVGVDVEEGMRRMYRRMPLSELSFFTTVLAIQQKAGGNLAEALNNLSTVLRARKMMREKVGALSSEAKASAWIIGSLPPGVGVMVSIMSPDYMTPLLTTPTGHFLLLGGGVWMLTGILVMRSMINFKM